MVEAVTYAEEEVHTQLSSGAAVNGRKEARQHGQPR